MGKTIKLCEPCRTMLAEAASRGGHAGSRESKVRAGELGAAMRQLKAKKITHNGKTLSVVQWATLLGIGKQTIWRRIRKGKPPQQILMPHGAEHLSDTI